MILQTSAAAVQEYRADEVLCAALDIGEQILKNGGEIHRVEDTIGRICKALGAEHIEVFTIPSLIIASVRMKNGDFSQQMRRIDKTGNNMVLVDEMNTLSRRICAGELSLAELKTQYSGIKARVRTYPEWLLCLANMLAAGGFAVFFGGSLRDCLCAMAVGVLVRLLTRFASPTVNQMMLTALHSMLAGLFCLLLVACGLGEHADKVMMGVIMLFIPGLALSNSIRDLFGGDMISGALQLLQAVLLAVMIALGFSVAIFILRGV